MKNAKKIYYDVLFVRYNDFLFHWHGNGEFKTVKSAEAFIMDMIAYDPNFEQFKAAFVVPECEEGTYKHWNDLPKKDDIEEQRKIANEDPSFERDET